MFCFNCGTKVLDNTKFCPECGTKLILLENAPESIKKEVTKISKSGKIYNILGEANITFNTDLVQYNMLRSVFERNASQKELETYEFIMDNIHCYDDLSIAYTQCSNFINESI